MFDLHFIYFICLQFTFATNKDDLSRAPLVLKMIFIQLDSPMHDYEYLTDNNDFYIKKNPNYEFNCSEIKVRLDYQPLFGKGARARNVDQARQSGGNRA